MTHAYNLFSGSNNKLSKTSFFNIDPLDQDRLVNRIPTTDPYHSTADKRTVNPRQKIPRENNFKNNAKKKILQSVITIRTILNTKLP